MTAKVIGLVLLCGLCGIAERTPAKPVDCSQLLTWMVAVYGLHQRRYWKQMPLIPLWDAAAFLIWLASFLRTSIRWRGADYYIRDGKLIPVKEPSLTHQNDPA